MELTNKFNLPLPIVIALNTDTYKRGTARFTTTGLLHPPRISVLQKKHWEQLEGDCADRLWAFMGQTKHSILEDAAKAKPDRFIFEQRYYSTVDGQTISGQIDLYDKSDKILYDYKECSLYKIKLSDFDDWTKQANINAFHCANNGLEVKQVIYIAFMRDWKMRDAKRDQSLPQFAIKPIELELWPKDKTVAFIRERMNLHIDAEKNLPECTEDERWAKPTKFAIMKVGNKKAVKVYEQQALAEAHMRTLDAKHSIQIRPGENTRCNDYCPVSDFCEQYKKLIADNAGALPASAGLADLTVEGEF